MGQTNQRGTDLDEPILDDAGENSLASIGAPRRTRVHVRMSEQTKGLADDDAVAASRGRSGALAADDGHHLRRPARTDRVRPADPGRDARDRREARP
ncbi:MAG: hypothetical protein P0Y60_10210 [Candidatus Microbacterium colombiense]|nr:MAG: hypothetical protein P0Y60_10210 [Microbacterium sp.]